MLGTKLITEKRAHVEKATTFRNKIDGMLIAAQATKKDVASASAHIQETSLLEQEKDVAALKEKVIPPRRVWFYNTPRSLTPTLGCPHRTTLL